ncbi:MAG TPA: hypothetical protein VM493_09370, partial [Vicinamibacterales bacterium]|nr:hypothetical protein [Vicinamibacterales bacterium]
FDAPELQAAARINPEKIALLRSSATVVHEVNELAGAIRTELESPGRLSQDRHTVADAMFHDPGKATARAVALARELLDGRGAAVPVATTHPAPGGAS